MIRQMLTGSFVLSLPGALAGIGLAAVAVQVLDTVKPAILVCYPPISMDWRVLAFTVALTLATSLLFGAVPALSAAGIHIQEALKAASQTHSVGRAAVRLRKALLVAELGVSLVLLIGAGLLARSFLKLAHTEIGFRSDHLLTFRINPIGPFDRNYGPFYLQVLDRLKRLPMAHSVALLTATPLSGEDFPPAGRVRVMGRLPLPFPERPAANSTAVSPEFFQTLGIALKSGDIFDAHDSTRSADMPVVVNEVFVRHIFPGENPIGQRVIDAVTRRSPRSGSSLFSSELSPLLQSCSPRPAFIASCRTSSFSARARSASGWRWARRLPGFCE